MSYSGLGAAGETTGKDWLGRKAYPRESIGALLQLPSVGAKWSLPDDRRFNYSRAPIVVSANSLAMLRRVAMFDDADGEGSPNLLRLKNEIVCGWIRSTGGQPLRRGKFAAKFLQFSTPWAVMSRSNLQGFGKFVNRTEGLSWRTDAGLN